MGLWCDVSIHRNAKIYLCIDPSKTFWSSPDAVHPQGPAWLAVAAHQWNVFNIRINVIRRFCMVPLYRVTLTPACFLFSENLLECGKGLDLRWISIQKPVDSLPHNCAKPLELFPHRPRRWHKVSRCIGVFDSAQLPDPSDESAVQGPFHHRNSKRRYGCRFNRRVKSTMVLAKLLEVGKVPALLAVIHHHHKSGQVLLTTNTAGSLDILGCIFRLSNNRHKAQTRDIHANLNYIGRKACINRTWIAVTAFVNFKILECLRHLTIADSSSQLDHAIEVTAGGLGITPSTFKIVQSIGYIRTE